MAESRKYQFSWEILGGDPADSRPNLGSHLHLAVYRLFQFTMRDVIEQRYGTKMADELFFESGVLAGREFFNQYCKEATDSMTLINIIQKQFRELGIGIFRVEAIDAEKNVFTLVVDEDLDCSGLPDTDDHICIYDEGFIKGILDSYTGNDFTVKEIDCWCSGSRTCRFTAHPKGE